MEKNKEIALTQKEIEMKLSKFKDRLEMWKRDHGDRFPPPLHFDQKTQEFHWINRKSRRK